MKHINLLSCTATGLDALTHSPYNILSIHMLLYDSTEYLKQRNHIERSQEYFNNCGGIIKYMQEYVKLTLKY